MELKVNVDTSNIDDLFNDCKVDVRELKEKYPFLDVRVNGERFNDTFDVSNVDGLNFVVELK